MSWYLLEGDPGLLQQVGLDVAARQLSSDVEVNADKLTLHSFIQISTYGPFNQQFTVKKRLATFPSPDGMSLTKLSLGGNNLIIPAQEEFGKWHTGMSLTNFYSVNPYGLPWPAKKIIFYLIMSLCSTELIKQSWWITINVESFIDKKVVENRENLQGH
jgi:hypothetical protein